MEIVNAFIGKSEQPSTDEVAAALGETASAWNGFLKWLAEDKGIVTYEWKTYSRRPGWTLRPILRKRIIVHLGPCKGCFGVAFALNAKAVEAARQAKLSAMPFIYPEGWGIRLVVKRAGDMAAVRRLVEIKLAN